jgi:hypothetical protein
MGFDDDDDDDDDCCSTGIEGMNERVEFKVEEASEVDDDDKEEE